MRHIKLFEDFKKNGITVDDVVKCISNDGVLYATIINNFPDNDPEIPLKPVSVDDDGLVTVELDGKNYEIDIKNIDSIND